MFDNKQYKENLQAIASLSNLFSDSKTPFLHYRAAENIFCKAFEIENLSRDDASYDARKEKLGIGLKTCIIPTFIIPTKSENKKEKIAEFNNLSHILNPLKSNLDSLLRTLKDSSCE